MKWIILPLFLLLTACSTKNIQIRTDIVKPPRPAQLKGVPVAECMPDLVCMSVQSFEKVNIYIVNLETYADQLETLLDSVTEEVR